MKSKKKQQKKKRKKKWVFTLLLYEFENVYIFLKNYRKYLVQKTGIPFNFVVKLRKGMST